MTEGVGGVAEGGKVLRWTWDELVLACDLLMGSGWHELDEGNKLVIELSELLRRLPIHPKELRPPTFRSPGSVRRKMADIATQHPGDKRKPTNGNKLDVVVLNAFLDQPDEMRKNARRLREGLLAGEFDEVAAQEIAFAGDLVRVQEGGLLVQVHLRRERSPKLRQKKIDDVLGRLGRLACEVCGFDFAATYGERGEGYAECHHVLPLHVSGEKENSIEDLAVLCANCHRMIHRGVHWLTPAELRELVEGRREG